MTKYRKKPVVVNASQWFREGDHAAVRTVDERSTTDACEHCNQPFSIHGWITTLEGGHIVCPADWIITGVKGEHYPCKPDIFNTTYEKEPRQTDQCALADEVTHYESSAGENIMEETQAVTKGTPNDIPRAAGPESAPQFDFLTHLQRQREWSEKTFGPEDRAFGIVAHIKKELDEIIDKPNDISEWIDVVILALDGAWRAGYTPDEIIAGGKTYYTGEYGV